MTLPENHVKLKINYNYFPSLHSIRINTVSNIHDVIIITPCARTRGKTIGSVHLSIFCLSVLKLPCLSHNKPVEKLASLCFKLFGRTHKHYKRCVFTGYMHAYQLHPDALNSCTQPSVSYRGMLECCCSYADTCRCRYRAYGVYPLV